MNGIDWVFVSMSGQQFDYSQNLSTRNDFSKSDLLEALMIFLELPCN